MMCTRQVQHVKKVKMKMALATETSPIQSALTHSVRAWFEDAKIAVKNRYMVRKTFVELSALTDAELADLGIHRSEIRSLAFEAVYARA